METVSYYVVGRGDMTVTDRAAWGISVSVRGVKRDLRGEPFVPKHYAVMLDPTDDGGGGGWTTENALQGRPRPEGDLDARVIPSPRRPSVVA
jgi:hypothetical protein